MDLRNVGEYNPVKNRSQEKFSTLAIMSSFCKNHGLGVVLLAFLAMLPVATAVAQDRLYFYNTWPANPGVDADIYEEGGHYIIRYRFIDHFNRPQVFTLRYPIEATNSAISEYGIPREIFSSYKTSEEQLRNELIRRGFFKKEGNIVSINRNALIDYYSYDYCRPIAQQIVSALAAYNRDTRQDRIEMAMKFVQDIPYGVPNFDDDEWYYGEYIPPPMVMLCMRGDCDTKAVLFACIMVHLIHPSDVVFLRTSGHLLTAVVESYGTGVNMTHNGKQYYLAETAGPGRYHLGDQSLYNGASYYIEDLKLSDPRLFNPIPYTPRTMIAEVRTNDNANTNANKRSTYSYSTNSDSQGDSGISTYNQSRASEGSATGNQSNREVTDYEWERRGSQSMYAVDVSSYCKIGAGISYYQGSTISARKDFETAYPAYIAAISLGLPISNNHLIQVNAVLGQSQVETVVEQLNTHTSEQVSLVDEDRSYFWEIEGGFLLFRFLRATAGYGRQEITLRTQSQLLARTIHAEYYTVTAGVVLRLGGLSLDAGLTAFEGRDFQRTGYKAYATVNMYIW